MIAAPEALRSQPADRALALPAYCYTDAAFAQRERERVFAASWQLVAHAAQLTGTGDHTVADVAGVPLVIVRGEGSDGSPGTLRALHNVCRHRAGPLATHDGRGARVLVCRYHGWTYGLDGCLLGAPEMHDAPAFERSEIRLPQTELAEWQHLVFARVRPGGPSLADIVDGIDATLGASFIGWRFDRRVSYEVSCNWKVYVDNFLEGYHLPLVHPSLAAVLDTARYRTELTRWGVLQTSPLDASQGPYGEGDDAKALYWWIWPNTMLNVLPGRLQTNRVVPLAADRCRVDFDYFYAPDAAAVLIERDHAFADQVQAEDIAICEAVQRGLASGSYVAGRLNPVHERGVHHFHELLRRAYAE